MRLPRHLSKRPLDFDGNQQKWLLARLNLIESIERAVLLVLLNAYRLAKIPLQFIHDKGRIQMQTHDVANECAPVKNYRSPLPTAQITEDVLLILRHWLTNVHQTKVVRQCENPTSFTKSRIGNHIQFCIV